MQEPFHVIVSTMRSGSSLCGHLLAEAGWIWYAGETHTDLKGEEEIEEAILKIRAQGSGSDPTAPPCDKVLGHRHLPKDGEFISKRASKIYLLLRHPLAIWRSQKETGWTFCSLKALADQLSLMRRLVETVGPERLVVMSYYELTQKDARKHLLEKSVDEYALNSRSGKAGWGDVGALIQSGTIREWTLEQDLERALLEIWMDQIDVDFLRAMAEYRKILKLVGREELDVEWAEHEFFTARELQIGRKPNEAGVAVVSVAELKGLRALPDRKRAFERIRSEELVHRCKPEELLSLLEGFKGSLKHEGKIRLSTIDLDFVSRLSAGEEPEYERWYRATFLPVGGERCSSAVVASHLTRSWGHRFLYNRETLQRLLEQAGLKEVAEVLPKVEERERMPRGFYEKERFVFEARWISDEKSFAKESVGGVLLEEELLASDECSRLENFRTLLFTNSDPRYLELQENLLASMQRVGFPMETVRVEGVEGSYGIYGSEEFNETVFKKLDLVWSLMKEGYSVLFVDVDIVFLKNPLPKLFRLLGTGVDAVFQSAGQHPVSKVNTGFFLVRPTPESLSLFEVGNWKPKDQNLNEIHDQQYINQKLKSSEWLDFSYTTLPLGQFPTGNHWFSGKADEEPVMVHYNYLKGVIPKIKKMKDFGHWYLGLRR
ncbi:MAG: putative nucleotide-diphospho-sugar transferase [Roseibacillus sp.]